MSDRETCFSCPGRIDLAGGTLDIPPLSYLVRRATTLNLAIDLRVHVRVATGDTAQQLVSMGGLTQIVGEGSIFDHALSYFAPPRPVHVHVANDIPRSAGLGGSSALLVALCRSLNAFCGGETMCSRELLDVVTVLEHRVLGKPAGTQDGIASIHGGLQEISYDRGRPQWRRIDVPDFLSGPLYLVHSSVHHNSGLNNWQIIRDVCEGNQFLIGVLQDLSDNARRVALATEIGDREGFCAGLLQEAALRSKLAPGLVPESMCALQKEMGSSVVGKICGAGGGGCMLVYGPELDAEMLKRVAADHSLNVIPVQPDPVGVMEELR